MPSLDDRLDDVYMECSRRAQRHADEILSLNTKLVEAQDNIDKIKFVLFGVTICLGVIVASLLFAISNHTHDKPVVHTHMEANE